MSQMLDVQKKHAHGIHTIEDVYGKLTHLENTVKSLGTKIGTKTNKQHKAEERRKKLLAMTKDERNAFLNNEYADMTDAQKTSVDKRRAKKAEYRKKKAEKDLLKAQQKSTAADAAVNKAEERVEVVKEEDQEVMMSPYTNPYLPRF